MSPERDLARGEQDWARLAAKRDRLGPGSRLARRGRSAPALVPPPPERSGRRPRPPVLPPGELPRPRGAWRWLAARRPRRRRLWDRVLGGYELRDEPILTSTRQAEALNPALVATHPPLAGPLFGLDADTGQPITVSPFELYAAGRVTSPNVVIYGAVGSGKSSGTKTQFVVRQIVLGRQVAVFDRKKQSGRGEYEPVAAACGPAAARVRFSRRGGTVVNILDSRIVSDSTGEQDLVGQDQLLLVVAELAHGPLTAQERYALRAAHSATLARSEVERREVDIRDVIEVLLNPPDSAVPRAELIELGWVDRQRIFEWGLPLALDLERFVDGDLSGLIDGPTTRDIDLTAPLLVMDTSDLEEGSPALALVMAIMSAFLSAVWSARPGQRLLILEEGYHAIRLPGVAAVMRSLAKRGRGLGLSVVTVVHHVSDVPEDSDGIALLREAGIVAIYAQETAADRAAVAALYGLPADTTALLATLPQGSCVLRVGEREPLRLVDHLRAGVEVPITDTDAPMLGSTLAAQPRSGDEPAAAIPAAADTVTAEIPAAAPEEWNQVHER